MTESVYEVTYAFDGSLRGDYAEVVSTICETVTELQREGIDVEFLGTTQEINGAGQLVEVTARYAAPSQGTVGRLNCRACLPASGPPQPVETDVTESDGRPVALAEH